MRLAVITGASAGIGAATARLFARRGTRVVLLARRADRLQKTATEIGPLATALACDVSDPDQVSHMAANVISGHGTPDVVINNAGAGHWKSLEQTTPDDALDLLKTPYLSAFLVSRAFLPAMRERKTGALIHVNSPAYLVAWRNSVAYAASRGALKSFHEALRQDLAGSGVTSSHVVFGKVATDYFAANEIETRDLPLFAQRLRARSPEYCAEALWQVAERPVAEAIFPWSVALSLRIARNFPGFARRIARL